MNSAPDTLVIGVGNPYRRDDAVGLVLARRLKDGLPGNVAVIEESGEGAALMEAWRGAAAVVIIDAARSGLAPGTVHRFDAHAGAIPTRLFHYSTHAFSVAEAVEMARALDQLPPRLVVYGVEGRDFSAGEGLSPEVAAASDELLGLVRTEIQDMLANINP